jgi:predicted porin
VNVRLGGYLHFGAYHVNDTADKGRVDAGDRRLGLRAHDFYHELEIHVLVDGKAANGMTYGLEVQIQNDGQQNAGTNGIGLDHDDAYIYMSGRVGTLRLGDTDNAANLIQVRPPGITGLNRDGYWDENMLGGARSRFTGINDGNDSTKIVYLSPQFMGFDFGVSFAPNAGEGESPRGFGFHGTRQSIQDEISAGIRWRGTVAGVGLALGAGAMNAGAPQAGGALARGPLQQVTAYTFGASATAMGFTLGGEYTFGQYSGASVGRAALLTGRDDSNHWLVALAYRIPAGMMGLGGVQLLAQYGEAEQDVNGTVTTRLPKFKQELFSVGAAYPIAPGLVGYANYSRMTEKNSEVASFYRDASLANPAGRRADIFLAGVRFAF